MEFKRINLITGWIVCLIACTVYIMTSEAGGSLWDCGEFVSSCFKVQIPHPPGAPLFVMLGRIFIVLFGNNPMTAAKAVNVMSALASGFTILFLFWTITHFARKIVHTDKTAALTQTQIISIMGAGIVGALAYTFCDSFWYSAVEGEVYAMSGFFTAIVFWCILKWENVADEPGADRWIVLIFFLIGLSIGVHLLCLLTIPAIVMAYYFRKKKNFNYKLARKYFIWCVIIGGGLAFILSLLSAQSAANPDKGLPFDGTVSGLIILGIILSIALLYLVERINSGKKESYGGAYIFFIIGSVLVGVVQVGVIQYSIKAAAAFDVFFVNSLGLPFFVGFTVFFILVAIAIWYGLRYAAKKDWSYLRLGLWCVTFMLIGYSSYLTTMIRSNADPAIDMYNVDNPQSLEGYLARDQYGDFPILYGQKFTASPIDQKETFGYEKTPHGYIKAFKGYAYTYNPADMMVFPRMWDASNDQNHADYYAMYMNIGKNKDGTYERAPTFGDNLSFFISYQSYFMFFRYFMWNFSGKQDDIEGMFTGNVRDGNWITGINFIDSILYGDQSLLPDSIKNNKAHNTLFALPFILGMIGLFYHFKKRGDDALVSFLLFFFTGFAIIIYLNQAGFQPRERDYAYAGAFYAFAIWIGIGVLKVKDWFIKISNQKNAAIIATLVCLLAVPVLMAQQEWDDHDRSHKQLARDLAKDYLESCAPNAILFTYGDNDTYPLWYAQEVEGIRPDIRVINTSLLGIDWYINQLRYKINQSDPIDVIWNADQIEGGKRDAVVYRPEASIPDNRYYDLYDMMKNYVGSDDPSRVLTTDDGTSYNTFPVRKVSIPVDLNFVKSNGTVNAGDSVVNELRFEIPPKQALYKGDLAILNIIAANKWKRPIYFTQNQVGLGFDNYLRRDGLAFRLVPILNSNINTDWMYNVVMNKFAFGNCNIPGVYFDEENRRHLNEIRQADAELALDLDSKNKLDSAKNVLERTDKMMLQQNFPYGMVSRGNDHNRLSMLFLEACYRANDIPLANKVLKSVRTDLQQQMKYYNALTGSNADNMQYEKQNTQDLLSNLDKLEQYFTLKQPEVPEKGAIISNDTNPPAPKKDNTSNKKKAVDSTQKLP
ncbi:MAG: glycosyltransferase family 117 protein [Chitinophagaceae bacterium]